MAVLNPPSALPGLARSITNHLIKSRASYDVERITALFAPSGISNSPDRTRGVDNTLRAARAIGLIMQDSSGTLTVPEDVAARSSGGGLTREEFRQVLRRAALNLRRDGNPWAGDIEARTAGARDLSRALSWFLAQDALGPALSWRGKGRHSVELLQSEQLRHLADEERPFSNDTRWGAFGRWALALGLAEPAIAEAGGGLVPLPLRAVRDVVLRMQPGKRPIGAFLTELATELPVLEGGVARAGLRALLGEDPDPGIRNESVDTSVSQSMLVLEEEQVLELTYGSDADARVLGDPEGRKVSNVEVLIGVRR
ncbi:protein DpdG [Micromonospora chersina]|uniref:protein DpdG n=1 Tax=Micromonospora chersina TaxID=47854 RepID=UPI00371E10EA